MPVYYTSRYKKDVLLVKISASRYNFACALRVMRLRARILELGTVAIKTTI